MNFLVSSTIIEFKSFVRQPASLFWTFVYPVSLMLVLSFVFGSSPSSYRDEIKVHLSDPTLEHTSQFQNAIKNLDYIGISLKPTLDVNADYVASVHQLGSRSELTLRTAVFSESTRLLHLALSADSLTESISIDVAETISVKNYNHYLISGVVALSVVTMGLFGFTQVLVSNRAAGRLKWLGYWPIAKVKFLLGFTLSRAIIIVIFSMVFIYFFGWLYDAERIWSVVAALSLVILLISGSVCFLSLGMLLACILHKPLTTASVTNLLSLPVIFLSDLVIPLSILPDNIAAVAKLSPVYLFVATLREVFSTETSMLDIKVVGTIFFLFFLGSLSFGVSGKFFTVTPGRK